MGTVTSTSMGGIRFLNHLDFSIEGMLHGAERKTAAIVNKSVRNQFHPKPGNKSIVIVFSVVNVVIEKFLAKV